MVYALLFLCYLFGVQRDFIVVVYLRWDLCFNHMAFLQIVHE